MWLFIGLLFSFTVGYILGVGSVLNALDESFIDESVENEDEDTI